MKLTDCGKMCHTESRAKALALASACYRRAYYCGACQAWHTTKRPLHGRAEPIVYRNPANRYEK